MELDWAFSRPFDFIHCRYLAGSIQDWPRLIAQAFKHCTPGGFVEFQDFDMKFYSTDGSFCPGSSPDVWTSEIVEALKTFNREPEPGPKLEGWIRDAGFMNVNHSLLPIPVGMWPKDKRMISLPRQDDRKSRLTSDAERNRRLRSVHVSRRFRSHLTPSSHERTELVYGGCPCVLASCKAGFV